MWDAVQLLTGAEEIPSPLCSQWQGTQVKRIIDDGVFAIIQDLTRKRNDGALSLTSHMHKTPFTYHFLHILMRPKHGRTLNRKINRALKSLTFMFT